MFRNFIPLIKTTTTTTTQTRNKGKLPWVAKIPWRKKWLPTPVFLPGESPWTEQPGELHSMGSQRVGHD